MSGRPELQLRLVQGGMVLFVVVCIFVQHLETVQTHAITAVQWVVVVAAIWSAISGFTLQRKINHPRKPPITSTPLARWKAGHLYRLSSATAVGL